MQDKNFEAFCARFPLISWYTAHRRKAFHAYLELPLPSFRYGLSISVIPDFDFSQLQAPEVAATLSYPKDSTLEVHTTLTEKESIFFSQEWEGPSHKISAFHDAYVKDFLVLRIPKHVDAGTFILTFQADQPSLQTILVHADMDSHAHIVLLKRGKASFSSDCIKILAERDSSVECVSIQEMEKDSVVFQNRQAVFRENARVVWNDVCLGSAFTKSDVVNLLNGKGADGKITVLFHGTGKQKFDLYTASFHEAQQTNSDIVTKGVIHEKARCLSRGMVKIGEYAAGSNGYEKQDVLLLSPDAEADAIPNLEIHNPDVKCSHGSTIGQLDKEKIFYLMSRGLSEEIAKKKIVEGYFAPVLDALPEGKVKEHIAHSLLAVLS